MPLSHQAAEYGLERMITSDSKIDMSALPETTIPNLPILGEKDWFKDGHIDRYLQIIQKIRHPQLKVFFPHPFPEGLENIIKAFIHVRKTEVSKAITVPLNIGKNHWTMLYIDLENCTVEYYDSFGKLGKKDEILNALRQLTARISQEEGKEYKFIYNIDNQLQNNGYQCGPWVLFFIEWRLKFPHYDVNNITNKFLPTDEAIAIYRQKVFMVLQHDFSKSRSLPKDFFKNEDFAIWEEKWELTDKDARELVNRGREIIDIRNKSNQ
jgi:Ulp1 family protease